MALWSLRQHLFHQLASFLHPPFWLETPRNLDRTPLHRNIIENLFQGGGDPLGLELMGMQPGAHPEVMHTAEGIELVMSHRLHEMGDASLERLCTGANAAVIGKG